MSSDGKIMEEGGEGPSHETPQAITITIMDPSALETTTLDSALVASVQAQSSSSRQAGSTLLMVPREGSASISVARGAKDLLQTVTETHMGTEELPVISNINSSEDTSEQSTIQLVTKTSQGESIKLGEVEEIEELGEYSSRCCLICNEEMQEEHIPVFKTQTTTSQRKVSVFLGGLVGQKLTSRKAHSDIICQKCFALLNKLDLLEVEIRDTKDEIVSKYQESVAIHGGRARRKKPAAARKSDYVFPKIEPEDEDEQAIAMEMDETFEPHVEDLMEEEHDRREDRDSEDEEWEPEFKKTRIKREATDADGIGPPKRKRGRPRKDAASKPKANELAQLEVKGSQSVQLDSKSEELEEALKEDVNESLEAMPQLRRFFSSSQNAWGQSVLMCNFCKKLFLNAQNISSHICVFKCVYCHVKKKSLTAIEQHIAECTGDKGGKATLAVFSCQFCSLFFYEETRLKSHMEEHVSKCLKLYSNLLKERGLAETPASQPPLRRGRPRKMSDCTVCGVLYASSADLQHHIKIKHSNTLPHACRLCQERYMQLQELEYHIVEHFLGPFTCEFCSIHFGLKYPFLRHMETHHAGDFLLRCEFCEYTTSSFNKYRIHRKEPHEGVENNAEASVCERCGEVIPKEEVEEHFGEHLLVQDPVPVKLSVASGEQYYKGRKARGRKKLHTCVMCNLNFSCPANLSRHNHAQHPEKYQRKCDTCSLRFKGSRALELHKDGHENGKCWCPVCKLKFRHHEHVEQHFQLAHGDVNFIDCEYCNVQLGSYSKYMYHCRTSHASLLPDRAEFRCKLCGAILASRLLLNKHGVKEHGLKQNALRYECAVCKKYVVNLDVHMNLHTRAVQYPCEECSEVFFMKSSLIGHQKLRHDLKARTQNVCEICSKGFVSKSLLRIHHEQVHLHKREHSCEYCGRSYKSKSALMYHLKVHTGDRPYKCQECGSGFHRPSALKSHMEGTHRLPYTYIYRKPHRHRGSVLMKTDREAQELIFNSNNPSSSITEIEVSKSIVIKSDMTNMNIVQEGMSLVESVDDGIGEVVSAEGNMSVALNESEIVTVVENLHELPDLYKDDVYIIQVMDD